MPLIGASRRLQSAEFAVYNPFNKSHNSSVPCLVSQGLMVYARPRVTPFGALLVRTHCVHTRMLYKVYDGGHRSMTVPPHTMYPNPGYIIATF